MPLLSPSTAAVRLRLIYREREDNGLLSAGRERGFDQLTFREEASPLSLPAPGVVRLEETGKEIRAEAAKSGVNCVFTPLSLWKRSGYGGGLTACSSPAASL